MPIIEVDHLTKEYRLGAMQSLKQALLSAGARFTGVKMPERPLLFKVLGDVSINIVQSGWTASSATMSQASTRHLDGHAKSGSASH